MTKSIKIVKILYLHTKISPENLNFFRTLLYYIYKTYKCTYTNYDERNINSIFNNWNYNSDFACWRYC